MLHGEIWIICCVGCWILKLHFDGTKEERQALEVVLKGDIEWVTDGDVWRFELIIELHTHCPIVRV